MSPGGSPLNQKMSMMSILKRLKALDDTERLYHAKLLQISAERASLLQGLDNSLTISLSDDTRSDSATAAVADSSTSFNINEPASSFVSFASADGYSKSLSFVHEQLSIAEYERLAPSENLWTDYPRWAEVLTFIAIKVDKSYVGITMMNDQDPPSLTLVPLLPHKKTGAVP